MPLLSGQKEIIKELIMEPYLDTLREAYPERIPEHGPSFKDIIWTCFHPSSDTFYSNHPETKGFAVESAFNNLRAFHEGSYSLTTTFREATPSLDELRLTIYEIVIDYMQEHFQSYRDKTPVLPRINDSETGMMKIRHLMTQYLTLTNLASIERYKLAHEINLEKRAINLPDVFPPGYNIFHSCRFNPGKFSHFDLSHLEFDIEPSASGGERLFGDGLFKNLSITNSNFEGTVFSGSMRFYGLNLNDSNLRGCELNFHDQMVLTGANVEGLYVYDDWIPPRDVNNRDKISHSLEAYQRFRSENFSDDMQVESVDIQIPSYGRILAALGEVNRSEESTADVQSSETPDQNLNNELVQLRAENERLRQELEELRNDRTLALNTSCNIM